jgi:HTH-type transcriptional regulator, quorum sensing regulator NprR
MIDIGVKKMGIDIGQAIKINRLRANMTQSDLASGIISVSYLSKIENGTAEPPNEVIEQLGERLEINLIESDDYVSESTIIRWFQHLLHSQKDESIRLYNRIKNSLANAIDKQLFFLIEIHKLYYYVLINDMHEARERLSSLEKSSKRFNETETYYLYKFAGSYHYKQLDYKKSLEYYQKAEKNSKSNLYHRSEEVHNLYYLIASAASKNRLTHLSLLYSNKSLEYYQMNYNLKKSADCHLLLGISYRRINDFEKAKECFDLAIKIANTIDDTGLLTLYYQNYGKVFSSIGNSEEAINNYLKSYELRKDHDVLRKLTPVSSLMQEYYNVGDLVNSKIWLELGIEMSKGLEPSESIHVYEFMVYEYLINGIDNSFESLITNHIIPFFSEKQLYFEESKYVKLLAKYYYDNRKYKLAATYYKMLSSISSSP